MTKKVIKRLMAKDGSTYQKNGQTKNGYMRCGIILKDDQDGSISIKISGLPIAFDGWLSAWDLEGQNAQNQAGMQQQAPPPQAPRQAPKIDGFDDDIPF